jgi:hypothetical protein
MISFILGAGPNKRVVPFFLKDDVKRLKVALLVLGPIIGTRRGTVTVQRHDAAAVTRHGAALQHGAANGTPYAPIQLIFRCWQFFKS